MPTTKSKRDEHPDDSMTRTEADSYMHDDSENMTWTGEDIARSGIENGAWANFDIPKYQSTLLIYDAMKINTAKPMPSRWNRLWLKMLLGWTWEPYDEESD